jgi:hypothetical protein
VKTATIECHVIEGMFKDEVIAEIGDRSFIVPKAKVLDAPGANARIRVEVFKSEGKEWLRIPTEYKELMPKPASLKLVEEVA